MIDEPSTINAWISQPGPINLRCSPRRPDAPPCAGLFLAVVAGIDVLIWALVAIRALT